MICRISTALPVLAVVAVVVVVVIAAAAGGLGERCKLLQWGQGQSAGNC